MAENKDITVPSAGNKKLQPDVFALGKTWDFTNLSQDQQKSASELSTKEGKKILSDTAFEKGNLGQTRLKTEKDSFERGPNGLLRRIDENKSGLIKPIVSSSPTQKRDSSGDGPKSTLRPSTKNLSAFGRSTPFSGWFPMKFKSQLFDGAVGGLGNPVEIPTFGLHPVSFRLGSTTLQGLNFSGGFPTMEINQNSTAPTTTFSQAENENA